METQETQLVKHQGTGMSVMNDFMPVFDIATAVARREAMVQFVSQILVEGTDFGKVPGSERACLLKPGAEKLSTFFGLVADFELEECVQDWTGKDHGGEPFFYYRYKCRLLKNGRSIGEGVGSCNSWESKYRYRWVQESALPNMPDDVKARLQKRGGSIWEPGFAIEAGETTGKFGKPAEYWQRFRDAIANGTSRSEARTTKAGKPLHGHAIDSTLYRIPNPDIADQVNTFQKMSQKRSQVAAVLVGVNASEYFTQDLEDATPEHTETTEQVAERRIAEEKTKVANQSRPDGTPPQQSGAPATSSESAQNGEVPAPVQAIWARMKETKGICDELVGLKTSLIEICGQEPGEAIYYKYLAKYEAKHANEFKSVQKARLCAWDLWKSLQQELQLTQKAQPAAARATDPGPSDSLLPDEMPAGVA